MQFEEIPVLPTQPGVYIFRSAGGVPIYIGKANNLRSRVTSHFRAGGKSGRFTREAANLEFITVATRSRRSSSKRTSSSSTARTTRAAQGRQALPVSEAHERAVPHVIVTRRVVDDGGSYYGPYPDGSAVRRVKNLIDTMFPLRKNSGLPLQRKPRPC
jgi:excinuclease ABC subunit C